MISNKRNSSFARRTIRFFCFSLGLMILPLLSGCIGLIIRMPDFERLGEKLGILEIVDFTWEKQKEGWLKFAGIWEGILNERDVCLYLIEDGTYVALGFPPEIGFAQKSRQRDWVIEKTDGCYLNLKQKIYFETDDKLHQAWFWFDDGFSTYEDRDIAKAKNEALLNCKMKLFFEGGEIVFERKREIDQRRKKNVIFPERKSNRIDSGWTDPSRFKYLEGDDLHLAMEGRWEGIANKESVYIHFKDDKYETNIPRDYFRFPLLHENEKEGMYCGDGYLIPWVFQNKAGRFRVQVTVKNEKGEIVYGQIEQGKKLKSIQQSAEVILDALRGSGELILQIDHKKIAFKRPRNKE